MTRLKSYFKLHPFAKASALLALFMLLFLLLMGFYFPAKGANGFSSFIVAFEFAKSVSEINSLFWGMSPAEIKSVDIGNILDFGFMISYSLFIAMLYKTGSKVFEKKWLLIGIPLASIIFLSDFIENLTLFEITKNYLAAGNKTDLILLLKKLHIVTWIKWGGLAFSFLLFAIVLATQRWFYLILAAICMLPTLYIIFLSNASPYELSIFTDLIFISFFALILFSFIFKKSELEKSFLNNKF